MYVAQSMCQAAHCIQWLFCRRTIFRLPYEILAFAKKSCIVSSFLQTLTHDRDSLHRKATKLGCWKAVL
jgi:hypothetical protein